MENTTNLDKFIKSLGFNTNVEAIKALGYLTYTQKQKEWNKQNSTTFVDPNKEFVKAKLKNKTLSNIQINRNGQVIGPSGKLIVGKITKGCKTANHKIEYVDYNGKIISESIPRIMWRTFVGEIEGNNYILTKRNLLKNKYALDNLQCVTPSERVKDVYRNLKVPRTYNYITKTSLMYKMSDEERLQLKHDIMKSGRTIEELARKYKVSSSTISKIRKNFNENKYNF